MKCKYYFPLLLLFCVQVQAQSFRKTYKKSLHSGNSAAKENLFIPFLEHKKYASPALFHSARYRLQQNQSFESAILAQNRLLLSDSLHKNLRQRLQRKFRKKYGLDNTSIKTQLESAQRWAIAATRASGTFDALDSLQAEMPNPLPQLKPDIEESYRLIVNSHLESTDYTEMKRVIKDFSSWVMPENYKLSRQLYQRLWPAFKAQYGACAMDIYAKDFPDSYLARDCWREEIRDLFCKKDLSKMLDFYAKNPYSALEVALISEISDMDKYAGQGVETLDSVHFSLLMDIRQRNAIINKFRGKSAIRDSLVLEEQANLYIKRYAPRYSAYQMLDEGLDYFIENQKYSAAVNFLKSALPYFPDSLPTPCKTNFPFQVRVKPFIRGKVKILEQEGITVSRSPMKALNTAEGNEFSPVISADGTELFFAASNRKGNIQGIDIFYSQFRENRWSMPFVLSQLSGKGTQIPCSLSEDATQMLVLMEGKLCLSKKLNNKWEPAQALIIPGIALVGRGIFAGSPDTILLEGAYTAGTATQAPDMDLFVSIRDKRTGEWSLAAGLGSDINTDDMESNAFLSADGKRLYYCSSGYPGLGGSDVFVSQRLKKDWVHWSPPVNLGKTINDSQSHHGLQFMDKDEKRALFTKFSEEKGDIWLLEFHTKNN